MTDLVWRAGALLAAVCAYQAANRGRLGWRFSGRPRAELLAAGVALFGAGAGRYIADGVRADGIVVFTVITGITIVAAVAAFRHVRFRWPTLGPAALCAVGAAILIPSVGAALWNTLFPVAVIGGIAWGFLRFVRRA